MEIVEGDLLDINNNCDIILQQLNCLCVRPHGLSNAISKKYPYANVYGYRTPIGSKNLATEGTRGTPGKIVVSQGRVTVIGLYGQYDFGKAYSRSYRPSLPSKYGEKETKDLRERWFKKCLRNLRNWLVENDMNSSDITIGIPYKIGCGLAGGDWTKYYEMLNSFSNKVNCVVKIYKFKKLKIY